MKGRWSREAKIVQNDVRMEYETELFRRRSEGDWDVWIEWPGNHWQEVHPDHLAELEVTYQSVLTRETEGT